MSQADHSCSYYCERPECIKAQRDELREKQAAAQPRNRYSPFYDPDTGTVGMSIQQQESAWKQRAENAEAEVKKLEFSWSGCATQLKDAIEELEIAESKAEELAKARAFMDEWEKAGGDAPHSVCSLRLRMEVQRNAAEKRINELQRGFGAAEEWGKLQAQLKEARDGWHVESGRADDAEARCKELEAFKTSALARIMSMEDERKEMRGMLERCNTELRDSDLGGEIYALLKEPQ